MLERGLFTTARASHQLTSQSEKTGIWRPTWRAGDLHLAEVPLQHYRAGAGAAGHSRLHATI
ncbi:hypothetical protein B0T16DRAFT_407027 [Cercophora newfieldiana]|uniref:Uncharacterized protein n=1 Tax=Cercophora newfieldiana TaxID=92897 RepID=A0AA39YIG1_9PEZI|nr:hypothetical protein B0T16DRAFT_407027 [Cercophora newfieldiana]